MQHPGVSDDSYSELHSPGFLLALETPVLQRVSNIFSSPSQALREARVRLMLLRCGRRLC